MLTVKKRIIIGCNDTGISNPLATVSYNIRVRFYEPSPVYIWR